MLLRTEKPHPVGHAQRRCQAILGWLEKLPEVRVEDSQMEII